MGGRLQFAVRGVDDRISPCVGALVVRFNSAFAPFFGVVLFVSLALAVYVNTVDLPGQAMGFFGGHDTVCANGYRDWNWARPRVGMSKSEVLFAPRLSESRIFL